MIPGWIRGGANHKMAGFSTCPFNIFGNGWEKYAPTLEDLKIKGDTVIGNDVWIGLDAMIMPGISIGDGAIIAAKTVVTNNIEPYTIVASNPARLIKRRFEDGVIKELLDIRW